LPPHSKDRMLRRWLSHSPIGFTRDISVEMLLA
jgi:hypothetical protein